MTEREIRIRTADGDMRTFISHPDTGGPFPVALVFMDGIGYREQVKENARRFAADGYYCAVPDLFHRSGEIPAFDFSGNVSDEERQRMMKIVSTVTPENMVADTRAVIAEVSRDSAASRGPMVCVGYCMGARVALHIAASMPEQFVAAAGIHPGALITDKADSPHHDLSEVRGELYFAFAEIDRSATAELVDQFRDEMQKARVRGVVERLPGVAHGFSMEDLPVYNRDAAERHFERTLDLWRRNLSAQPVA
ncbi:MAG TPA: dienelactone hydrolase family protein [Candidatus Dormibacteraeota bacterium]|nr:dienelactone hydrolase family protein [Candidatus Dormibacteraeota bacterium]